MSTVKPGSPAEQTIPREEVRAFRRAAIANGYPLIRVRSHDKAPLARGWQGGEDAAALLDVQPEGLNTGLVLAGLRCIDVDVNEPQLVSQIIEQVHLHLPPGALIRRRANSPRVAIFFRAPEGQQPTRKAIGHPSCKVEVLGAGQQAVVHGLHPTGSALTWDHGRGPDTVPLQDLPVVSEEQIGAFLSACKPLLGEPDSLIGPGLLPATASPSVVPVPNNLGAGIETPNWFAELTAEQQTSLVAACLDVIENRTTDPRDRWLRVLFAVAEAQQLGCPDAYQLALEWSQRGTSWTSEADFDTAWNSFKPNGGVTIGYLLWTAGEAGLDLSPWRDTAFARMNGGLCGAQGSATQSDIAIDPHGFVTFDPDDVPPHRQWSVGTKLITGEVTVLAAKGGWGKSAYSIGIACSAACGRDFLGLKIYGGSKPVLYINSEDDTDELQRRFIAAARHHGMTKADLANIMVRGVNTPGHETLTTGDESAPRINEKGFAWLDGIITKAGAEIVVLDPLGTFCPAGLNHNGVMGQVVLRLKRLAKTHGCAMLIVHHTRKDGDLTNTDAIGGASAIVNQARVAMMIARMTAEEAKQFDGVLPRDQWRYFRVLDAKTNLAPPASDAQWYQLCSHELPNAAPPTYGQGDGVQVVDLVDTTQLCASPAPNGADNAARRAILKAAYTANPPYSPSSKGGSGRYIVPNVLGLVRQTTGVHWPDRDLTKYVQSLVKEMIVMGWLRVVEVKVGRNPRQGLVVDPARTPWAHEFTANSPQQPPSQQAHQMHQMPIEAIDANELGGIDARRPEGASNVLIGSGDLMQQAFDAVPHHHPAAPAGIDAGAQPRAGAPVPTVQYGACGFALGPQQDRGCGGVAAKSAEETPPLHVHVAIGDMVHERPDASIISANATKTTPAPQPGEPARVGVVRELPPTPGGRSAVPEGSAPSPTVWVTSPAPNPDDLEIPDFLDRRKRGPTS